MMETISLMAAVTLIGKSRRTLWRRLADGSLHEVMKNFPTRDEVLGLLGPTARQPRWLEHEHFWALHYTVA